MQPSQKDTLNRQDIEKWVGNTFIFSIPAWLALLTALQHGADFKIATGMFYQSLIASGIDLLSKYKAGN